MKPLFVIGLIVFVLAGGCNINIGSNVMTIYPGANVANATQEQEANITLTTMPEQEPAQGQGDGFMPSFFGLMSLVVIGGGLYVWNRKSDKDYIGEKY